MSWWRLKSPGLFPVRWHELMRETGQGEYLIDMYRSRELAVKAQREWALFQYCLRYFAHPTSTYLVLPKHTRRTFIERELRLQNAWALKIRISKSTKAIWSDAEILIK
jgi:hypothetical protein